MFGRSQYKKFMLEGDVLHWKERTFPITAIKHLFFRRVLTTQRMNFVKVGEAHSSYLTITMDDGEKISLSFDESTIFLGWNRDKTQDLKNLEDLYIYLARTSFQKRIAPYVRQVEERGYFEYGGCRFIPRDKKIIFRDKEFPVAHSSFLRGAGYVEMRKKDFGLLDKVKREISLTKIPQFNTQTDTDVIFSLLDHYFGLRWN